MASPKLCSVLNCSNPAECRSLCNTHYRRWKRNGDAGADRPIRTGPSQSKCAVASCSRTARGSGFCDLHHIRWVRGSHLDAPIRDGSGDIVAGDGGLFRICKKCDLAKPIGFFYPTVHGRLGRVSQCKDCHARGSKHRYEASAPAVRERVGRYRSKNLDKIRETKRRYVDANRAKIGAATRRRRKIPKHRIASNVRVVITRSIRRGSKRGRKTFSMLGYTPVELKSHLERQFLKGMSWDNYGPDGWHIDHIVPLALFNYSTPDDPDFKAAWALSNLRPLWRADNLAKRSKRLFLL